MPIVYAPQLVEAVVRRCVDLDVAGVRRIFRRLYEDLVRREVQHDPAELERLHEERFVALGLDRPVRDVAAEFPGLPDDVRVGPSDKLEGCFLPESRKAVLVRLRPERFLDAPALKRLLRHEWAHVVDMLDPRFGYPSGEVQMDPPSRDRFALLWSAHVDARLARAGREPLRAREAHEAAVARWWPEVPGDLRERAFTAFWLADALAHDDLLSMARDPGRLISRFTGVPVRAMPGGRCPLCGFPTFSWGNGRVNEAVAKAILADFPSWDRAEGACERCVDLYEVRAGAW